MSVELLIATCLRLAGENIKSAELLLDNSLRTAPTLAAQAVEHLLIALCHAEGFHLPRAEQHQLDTIARRLPDSNPYKLPLRRIAWLEAYMTTYRYPRTHGRIPAAPDPAKVSEALDQARVLLAAMGESFGVELSKDGVPAANAAPPREA